jgi:hypothetical protein
MFNNLTPSREIPNDLILKYSMNGKIPIFDYWLNDSVNNNQKIVWSKEYLDNFINIYKPDNIKNDKSIYGSYGNHSVLKLLESFEKYNIINKNVAVIGSQSPWIESILLNLGNKVTTIEYNVPECNYNNLKCKHYFTDFKDTKEMYDTIVTFSSIEHSGLGRYGDPLDPDGDIKAMTDIYNNLKSNGLCIWGAPVGADVLAWNAHRIYGKIRLPLLFNKFQEVEWFGDKETLLNLNVTKDAVYQPVVVLKKIN